MPRAQSPLTVASAVFAVAFLFPVYEAEAQPDNAQIRAQKRSTPHRTAPAQPRVDVERANRHLLSPMGSAANVRRGWYRRNLSQPVVQPNAHSGHRGHGYGYGVPYVVYVDPTPREPVVIAEPRSYEPPPIYIVQPQSGQPQPVQPRVVQPQPVQPQPTQQPVPTWQPPVPAAPTAPQEPAAPPKPRPTEPQPVSIGIHPADAIVYLDGELLGSAGSLGELDLRPGVYVLEVEHETFAGQRLVFGVDEDPLTVAIDLTADRPNRRSRVK